MLGFVLRESLRDVRRAGHVGVSAVLLIALSLAAVGGFWLASINLGRAIAQWRDRVRLIAYLRDEPAPGAVDDLLRRIQAIGGVQRVRYVSKTDALAALKRSLGDEAEVADHLPRNPLPASVEIAPAPDAATPEGTRELAARLSELPDVEDVQGGAEWVEGLAKFQHLFQLIGLAVGAVLALAAVLTVTTATTLVLHSRREEMEIMRLVGATELTIRLPRLVQGLTQGLIAGTMALVVLGVAYAITAPRLEPLLPLTLGLDRAVFLSAPDIAALIGGGALLGAVGGLLATRHGPR